MKYNIKPIFIFGIPKSGSTLLNSLFDGHENISTFPVESRVLKRLYPLIKDIQSIEELIDKIVTKTGFASFNPRVNYFKVESNFKKKEYIELFRYPDFFSSLKKNFKKINIKKIDKIFEAIAIAIAEERKQDITKLKYYVAKTPENEFMFNIIKKEYL